MHSAIYTGWLDHRRHAPRVHAFRYRLFMVYLDLAELDRVFAGRWFWSCRRAALARFDRRDHMGDPALPLDESVRRLVEEQTGRRPEGPVRLLTHLRYFGHVFNPVSFYYCYAADGEVVDAVVAEVTNTPWGERHCYVVPRRSTRGDVAGTSAKAMHVSPFHPMALQYDWRFGLPEEALRVHMRLSPLAGGQGGDAELATADPDDNVDRKDGVHACSIANDTRSVFDAGMSLRRQPITALRLASILARFPLMTLQVVVAIHWQALRLWLKRVPVFDHPARSDSTTLQEIA